MSDDIAGLAAPGAVQAAAGDRRAVAADQHAAFLVRDVREAGGRVLVPLDCLWVGDADGTRRRVLQAGRFIIRPD